MAKRILIYTNHFYPENFKVNEIADILADQGNYVHVITGLPNYPAGKIFDGYGFFKKGNEEIRNNLTVKRLPLIPRGDGSKFRLILNYLSYFCSVCLYTLYIICSKKKFDVVFVHHTSPFFITLPPALYSWIRGSKSILWDLDMWPDTLVALGMLKTKIIINVMEWGMSRVYRTYDHILLGSRSFLEKAIQRVGEGRAYYFPNWAEEIFERESFDSPDFEYHFPEGLKIMYAGNIGQAQDFQQLLKTIIILKDKPVSWLLVGDGRKREWFEKQIILEGLTSKVIFYGNQHIRYMPYFFSNADIMFLSLKDELIFHKTVPAKLQAYMASGKPVLAMISGEGAKLIKESSGGLVADSGDFKELSNLVIKFLELDQEDLVKMGANNLAYYKENFSLQARKEQLIEII